MKTMETMEVRPMNGQRVALAVIIFFLFAAVLLQTTMTSCSSNDVDDNEPSEISDSDDGTFFHSLSENGNDMGNHDWEPVSDYVLEQMLDIFENTGIEITSVECSEIGSNAVRCTVESRANVPEKRQLMDALWILHETYPEQRAYFAELARPRNTSVETDWDVLVLCAEEGYSFDTLDEVAVEMFERLVEGLVQDNSTENAFVTIGSSKSAQ
jgi:hypothetical protein